MRVPPDRRSKKASKKSTASERPVDAQRANDYAAIEAELEKSPFHKGNTAGGRKPPYKPEYAIQAKAMCERGATTDELAEALGVSPKTIRMWQLTHDDFLEACKLTPACTERVRRSMFDSSIGQKIFTERAVESGSQRQNVKTTTTSPGNLAAGRSFVIEQVVPVEGEIAQLLKQLQGTRARPQYTGPNGTMISEEEHAALGGIAGGGEIDWSKKSPEEIIESKRRLLEMRRKP